MKKQFSFKDSGIIMLVVMLMCSLFGVGGLDAMTADTVVAPTVQNTVTVNSTDTASPNLLLDTIDSEVCKIRPHNVVLSTIASQVKSVKTSKSQVIRHYAIDAVEITTTLSAASTSGTVAELTLTDPSIVNNDDVIIVKTVPGYILDGGTTQDLVNELQLYVKGKNAAGAPIVVALNGSGANNATIPIIALGKTIMVAGSALSETQMQTDCYNGVPIDSEQYLQIFCAQIEESEMEKLIDKEAKWNFSDLEEEALYKMRRAQNISFWKGVKRKLNLKNSRSSKSEDIYFSAGIWNQAGKQLPLGATVSTLTSKDLVKLMKHAFTGNESGKKKLLIYGSDFLEAIENVEFTKNVTLGAKQQEYGLEFSSIISKFGTLLGVHDKTFDDMGMADKAFILDADFLRKWTMGWKVKDLDFKSNGEKNVDGRTFTEICALVLKNPQAHSRVALGTF